MLDLLKLESFRMVANTRSFTRAAAELGYSQSSVTAHVQALEREVGAPLFERQRFSREIALTGIGRRTLEYASRLLALAQETSIAIHSQTEPSGRLKICADPLLLAYRISPLIRQYQDAYPQVGLTISSYSDPRTLTGSVLNGVADVAFIFDERITSERLVSERIGSEKLTVVCSREHPLARRRRDADFDTLAQHKVLFSDTNCAVRGIFERALSAAGVQMDNAIEAGSVEAVKRCAAEGLGFGVLPAFAVERELSSGELVAVPLRNTEFTLEIQMARNARSWVSPALQALWGMTRPGTLITSVA
jgi:DNA-binding transcriptional LysR family regulator